MTETTSDIEEIARQQTYLIFDPNLNIKEVVIGSLKAINIQQSNIHFSKTKNQFLTMLKEVCPSFIICYTDPKSKEVFDFIDEHKKIIPDHFSRNFIIFSESKSIFTLAQALEEEIDSYFVPPYAEDKIANRILNCIKSKRFPTEYRVLLNDVNNKIANKEFSSATLMGTLAIKLHPRPSLAYYYLAKSKMIQDNLDDAIKLSIQGLKFNKEHYKCLMILHDLYYLKGNFDSSYRVLKKIFDSFPLSMIRIFDFFKLSIQRGDFKELRSYCRDILGRNDENILLVRFCTSGLAICAINELSKQNEIEATEQLMEALKYSQNDAKILRNLYKCFINYGLQNKSEEVFSKFKDKDKESLEWEVCKYLREIHSSKPVEMIINESEERFKIIEFDEDCITHLTKRAKKEADEESLALLNKTIQRFHL
jgi:tetratricopeptide (TPR) repeat protein